MVHVTSLTPASEKPSKWGVWSKTPIVGQPYGAYNQSSDTRASDDNPTRRHAYKDANWQELAKNPQLQSPIMDRTFGPHGGAVQPLKAVDP